MSSYIQEMHDELVDKLNPSEMDEFEASQEEKSVYEVRGLRKL